MPIRILHVTLRLGGGVATAIGQYTDAIPEAVHELTASSAGWAPSDPSYFSRFAAVSRLPLSVIAARSVLRDQLAEGFYDVVHAHSTHAGAIVRTLHPRCRVVYTPHALATTAPFVSPTRWLGSLERVLGIRAITFAAVSEDEAERVHKLSPRSRVIRIINLPTVPVSPKARYSSLLRVAGCGRLVAQKDPHYFRRVAWLCRQGERPFSFTWIGGGSRRETVAMKEAGVTVTGWLDAVDALQELEKHNVYLHSARYEGAAYSLLDAAALGLPVIGRSVPGLAELKWVTHISRPSEGVAAMDALLSPQRWASAAQLALTGVTELSQREQRTGLLNAYGLTDEDLRRR